MENKFVLGNQTFSDTNTLNTIALDTFEKYQRLMEKTILDMSTQIATLEQKLNVFTNLLEISQYINQYIKSQDLFPLINDMLIGVFGAKYSTIYLNTNGVLTSVTPLIFSYHNIEAEKHLIIEHHKEKFIINSQTPIYHANTEEEEIYSCLGVPIKINNTLLGFILIQHQSKQYFSTQHATFLTSLANHIGVAIENNMLYNQIKECACKDGLTNIFNKKYFFDTLHSIPDLLKANYALVMIDIDNFKRVNDTYGHPYGDIVLKNVAHIIKNNTRSQDVVARYGGEEIIIYFSNFTNMQLLAERLNKIRLEIEDEKITDEKICSSVTVSIGCFIKRTGKMISLEEAIKKADANLYICKNTGKNKVIISE